MKESKTMRPLVAGFTIAAVFTLGCGSDAGPPVLVDFEGSPVVANPLPAKDVTVHPQYDGFAFTSVFHSDHYNSDVMAWPGPLGNDLQLTFQDMGEELGGVCATPRVDLDGNIVVSCQDGPRADQRRALFLMDPDLNILAKSITDEWVGAQVAAGISGGIYPHVLRDGTVINGTAFGEIERYEVVGSDWIRTVLLDLGSPDQLGGDAIFEVAEDYAGNMWVMTTGDISGGAQIGYVDGANYVKMSMPGEIVENGMAIGEDGIFVLTDTALHMFTKGAGVVVEEWSYVYENSSTVKLEFSSTGSGATPTLLGRNMLAIVDDAEPQVNLLVLRREPGMEGSRVVCEEPLFEAGASLVDVSPIGYNNSLIIGNWAGTLPAQEIIPGVLIPPIFGDMRGMAGGFVRYDVNGDQPGDGCTQIWSRPDVVHNTVPKLSTSTGLIYTYTQDLSWTESNAYYFEAIDFVTGNTVWRKLSGTDVGGLNGTVYNNGLLTTALHPDGAVYQGIAGGLMKLSDQL